MKILVFGKSGQVGQELVRRCPAEFDAVFLGRKDADLSVPEDCASAILATDADVVINAAAWTAVDRAEAEEEAATIVNGTSPTKMARACAAKGIPFLHLSTDYVFEGTGAAPFLPDDATAPQNAYGRSKLLGEIGVRNSGARHVILRTSWVFSAHGTNFVTTMLRLGRERDKLRVVADQTGGPTPASSIGEALFSTAQKMTRGARGGTYHFAGAPDISWAGFARVIMSGSGLECRVEDIPSADYPTPAKRPLNSRLDCSSFERDFGIQRPDWRNELAAVLSDLGVNS